MPPPNAPLPAPPPVDGPLFNRPAHLTVLTTTNNVVDTTNFPPASPKKWQPKRPQTPTSTTPQPKEQHSSGFAVRASAVRLQHSVIPCSKDVAFCGRRGEIRAMREELTNMQMRSRIVVHGSPGCGKSAMTEAAVFTCKHHMQWWVDASTRFRVETALADIASNFLLLSASRLALLLSKLKQKLSLLDNWLIVFDGAYDCVDVLQYVPMHKGCVVVTCRSPPPDNSLFFTMGVALRTLADKLGIKMLLKYGVPPAQPSHPQHAALIYFTTHFLASYPLAMRVAAEYIRGFGLMSAQKQFAVVTDTNALDVRNATKLMCLQAPPLHESHARALVTAVVVVMQLVPATEVRALLVALAHLGGFVPIRTPSSVFCILNDKRVKKAVKADFPSGDPPFYRLFRTGVIFDQCLKQLELSGLVSIRCRLDEMPTMRGMKAPQEVMGVVMHPLVQLVVRSLKIGEPGMIGTTLTSLLMHGFVAPAFVVPDLWGDAAGDAQDRLHQMWLNVETFFNVTMEPASEQMAQATRALMREPPKEARDSPVLTYRTPPPSSQPSTPGVLLDLGSPVPVLTRTASIGYFGASGSATPLVGTPATVTASPGGKRMGSPSARMSWERAEIDEGGWLTEEARGRMRTALALVHQGLRVCTVIYFTELLPLIHTRDDPVALLAAYRSLFRGVDWSAWPPARPIFIQLAGLGRRQCLRMLCSEPDVACNVNACQAQPPRHPALHLAACRGLSATVRLLVELGADVTLRDDADMSAEDYASAEVVQAQTKQAFAKFLDLARYLRSLSPCPCLRPHISARISLPVSSKSHVHTLETWILPENRKKMEERQTPLAFAPVVVMDASGHSTPGTPSSRKSKTPNKKTRAAAGSPVVSVTSMAVAQHFEAQEQQQQTSAEAKPSLVIKLAKEPSHSVAAAVGASSGIQSPKIRRESIGQMERPERQNDALDLRKRAAANSLNPMLGVDNMRV